MGGSSQHLSFGFIPLSFFRIGIVVKRCVRNCTVFGHPFEFDLTNHLHPV